MDGGRTMRASIVFLLGFTSVFGTLIGAERGRSAEPVPANRIIELVTQLGSDRFGEREAATQTLEAVGSPALDTLRKAGAHSPDLEIRLRSERLIQTIEKRVETAQLL